MQVSHGLGYSSHMISRTLVHKDIRTLVLAGRRKAREALHLSRLWQQWPSGCFYGHFECGGYKGGRGDRRGVVSCPLRRRGCVCVQWRANRVRKCDPLNGAGGTSKKSTSAGRRDEATEGANVYFTAGAKSPQRWVVSGSTMD